MALDFMKKLSNSPWGSVVRVIEDAEVVGSYNSWDLREDLEDCAVVAEDPPGPTDSQPYNAVDECSDADSDSIPRYSPSDGDSDDSEVVNELIECGKSLDKTAPSDRTYSSCRPCPKSKKPKQAEKSDGTVDLRCEDWMKKPISCCGEMLKLKTLTIVLVDLSRVDKVHARARSCYSNVSSCEDGSDADDDVFDPKMSLVSDSKMKSSEFRHLKRPISLSWGLDSIQELKKHRKLGGMRCEGNDDMKFASLEEPTVTEMKEKLQLSSSERSTLSTNPFGLDVWRLSLAVQELHRLVELADKLQKGTLKCDQLTSIAYKLNYGLTELCRLVMKKTLNGIIAEQTNLTSGRTEGTNPDAKSHPGSSFSSWWFDKSNQRQKTTLQPSVHVNVPTSVPDLQGNP